MAVPPRLVFAQENKERVKLSKALAHHIMGATADLYENSALAIREYNESLAYNPDSYLTRFRLGAHYARMGLLDEALEHLAQVSVLNPEDIQSRYILALIYSAQKKFDLAAAEYEIILKNLATESPENVNLFFYLGQLYYAQFQYDKAIAQFLKILEKNPKNVEMRNFIGALYVELKQDNQAIAMFKEVLNMEPDNDMALNSLGYIYAEQGNNLDEAMTLVKRAIAIVPDSAAYLDSLGWVYYKQGRYQEALDTLFQAQKKIKDPIILEHIGDVYLALKKNSEAKEYWKRAYELRPSESRLLEKIKRIEGE